jgi:threonine dehydrogenase-like Zn-dependent dehydrogenase
MKAIVNTGPGRLEMQDWPTPAPGPGQVRVRTAACGICATDLKMIAGWDRTGFPAIPGHEWSGIVDATGPGVDVGLVGRRCVAENVLTDGGEVGFEHPGGYAEFLITEARHVQPLPDGFPLAVAALIEPLAVSVRAVRRMRMADSSAALIFGDGPIGLILLMLLVQDGVREVMLVGGRPGRLELARELGAALTLNYHDVEGDLADAVKAAAGRTFPNTIEASGSASAAQACADAAANEGRVLIVGDYDQARAGFPWMRVLIGELEIIGSNASAGAWPEAVRLAIEGSLPLERLITQRLPADRFEEGVALVRSRRPDVIKVVLEWQ